MPPTGMLKRSARAVRDLLYFHDQDGFFEESLYTVADVRTLSITDTAALKDVASYDALIVNWKQGVFSSLPERCEAITKVAQRTTVPKALFVGAAQVSYLPPEGVLDQFDIIFKREPYRDRGRYDISEANRRKIVPTMIYCPFVHATKPNIFGNVFRQLYPKVYPCTDGSAGYDVGFSGADAADHTLRRDVWARVLDERFKAVGGLQPNPRTKNPISLELQGPRLSGRAYRDSLCQAKINLALDGIGEYTFRHQELLYLGAFMLSSPSIRALELPMPLQDGRHYVAFDDLDDMTAKIRHYLADETERQKIAAAGKKLFNEYYQPSRHGAQLCAALTKQTS